MTDLLVVVEDIHGGSNVAVCPPGGMELDDGQTIMPSKAQRWLWKKYKWAWRQAQDLKAEINADTTVLAINGDMVDGNHHGTSQIATPLESFHVRVAHKCLTYALEQIRPDQIHMTRGTGAHVGKAGTLEEGLARVLRDQGWPLIEDPDTAQVTSYHRRYELGGLLVDQRHHGLMGRKAHTRGPYMRYYAQEIELEHRLDEERPPDLALRAHNHIYGDSGRDHRWKTRVIAGPCWQLMTEYSHRKPFEALPSIGIYAVVIRDGRDEVVPFLAKPDRPTVVK